MHFHHAPHHTDDDPPTMPANVAGFTPSQRTPADNQIFDEATTEVPVITPVRPEAAPPSPAQPEAPAATSDAPAAPSTDETHASEAAAEATDETADEGAADDQAATSAVEEQTHVPWADLASPAPVAEEAGDDPAPVTAESAEEPAAQETADEQTDAAATEPEAEDTTAVTDDAASDVDEAETGPDAQADSAPAEAAAPATQTPPAGTGPAATEDEGTTVQATLEETEASTSASARPGDVAETPITVWSEEEAQRLRTEWRELQIQFIDEPTAAVAGAKRLVTEAVEQLSQSLLAQRDQLDPQSEDPDTEALRVAMRRYREFLDRLLAL